MGGPGESRDVDPLHPVSAVDLLRWAETLSAVARTGLGFTQSLYERERFETTNERYFRSNFPDLFGESIVLPELPRSWLVSAAYKF